MFYKWIKCCQHFTDLSFIMYFGQDIIYAAELSNVLLHFMFNHLCLMIFTPYIPFLIHSKNGCVKY